MEIRLGRFERPTTGRPSAQASQTSIASSKYPGQNQFRHHIGTTYVAVEHGRIYGFAALEMAAAYGCVGVVVDAKPDAVSFYERFGFAPLDVIQGQVESRPRPRPMFLPLELVALAITPTR